MRVLITGGAGFIGSHLVDRSLAMGYRVRVLDNLEPRVHVNGCPPYISKDVEFIQGDVRNKTLLANVLKGVDIISHHAAYQDHMPDFSKFMSVNVTGTALLFELIKEKQIPVKRVIVASSQAVYGEGQYECPEHGRFLPSPRTIADLEQGFWDVKCPQCGRVAKPLRLREEFANPFNAYALSKYSEEMLAIRLGRLLDVPTVALRYSITQGARQSPFNAYSGICRIFITRLMNQEPPLLFEDGQQTRDFLHVQDLVDAHMCVLNHPEAEYHSFNVGSGRSTTLLEYVQLLMKAMGIKDIQPVISGEYRVGDSRHSVSSIDKLKRLGWKPKRDLSDIFQDYLNWIYNQNIVLGTYTHADKIMRDLGVIRRITQY